LFTLSLFNFEKPCLLDHVKNNGYAMPAKVASLKVTKGGNLKPDNITELMTMPDIDGGLIGGASLEPETFSKIVQFKK